MMWYTGPLIAPDVWCNVAVSIHTTPDHVLDSKSILNIFKSGTSSEHEFEKLLEMTEVSSFVITIYMTLNDNQGMILVHMMVVYTGIHDSMTSA